MAEAVRYEVAGGVATLTMDQPETRNALSEELLAGLASGLARALADEDARLILLSHTGPAFCAGADLKGPATSGLHELAGVLSRMLDSPKPVLGRIAGHCMGGGVGLAAACDISVASTEATLGFTEVRLGVAPAVISVVCLPKMRRGDALELFLTGERISAARAVEVGLISRAVPPGDLDRTLGELVGKVLKGGPSALAAAKNLVFDIPTRPRGDAFDATAALSHRLFESDEAREGIAAFRQRRLPSWVPGEGGGHEG